MVTRSAVVGADVRLEYVETGHPNGLPVVFLHGVTDSWTSFEGTMERLPESIRAIAVSQRGHGNSSRPAAGYSMEYFSRDVRHFMDALELPAAVIVGHSMGGFVAQRFTAEHPDRTKGVVLMGTAPGMARNPVVRDMVSALDGMVDPIDAAFVREFQASTLARPVNPALFHGVVAESLKVPVRVWRDAFRGFLDVDHSAVLRRIQAPAIIAWGSCDTIFSAEEQAALRDAIPRGRLVRYVGGGHAFHWEDPATFAADLAAFCKEVHA
jgi:pimeloyl-ACP methyl ester carboxylesterase